MRSAVLAGLVLALAAGPVAASPAATISPAPAHSPTIRPSESPRATVPAASATRPPAAPVGSPAPGPSPRSAPPSGDNSARLYTLDGFGGVHGGGAAPPLASRTYYGWDIARGLALLGDGSAGYQLDGFGAIHAVGPVPELRVADYFGWDIARSLALAPWATAAAPSGWVLDGWGGVHAFGGAPGLAAAGYWAGWDIARSLVVTPDSTPSSISGYVLDGFGGLHPFGQARPAPEAAYPGWDIVHSIALLPAATAQAPAGYTLDGFGGVHPFGSAPAVSVAPRFGWDIARSLTIWNAPTTGPGGWVLDGWGGVHQFGSAPAVAPGGYWNGWDIARGQAGPGAAAAGRRPTAPGTRVLNVPYYHQAFELTCEEASLRMLLASRGIATTDQQILDTIGIDWRTPVRDASGFHWGDPYASYVGDPGGSEVAETGYGTYWSTIAGAARRLGGSVLEAGEQVEASELYRQIRAGHPAVAWIAFDWAYHATSTYVAFDGRTVMYGRGYEHAVAVVGVSADSVLVNNPWSGPQWVTQATFEGAYATFNRMAVVVV